MTFFSLTECKRWCAERRIPVDGDVPGRPACGATALYEIPQDARSRMEMARAIVDWLRPRGALLWMYGWPLYLPDEMRLYLRVRGDPEQRSPITTPGVLLSSAEGEQDVLVQLIYLAFTFNWYGYVLNERGMPWVWLADEIVEVCCPTASSLASLASVLGEPLP